MEPTIAMIEDGAKAISEYQAPKSWDFISEELKDAYRNKVEVILSAALASVKAA